MSLAQILGVPKALIGMVHLLPLPGSPRWGGAMEEVIRRALDDAQALQAGGLDALLIVGTFLKRDGRLENPDPDRVRRLVEALRGHTVRAERPRRGS